MALPFAAPCPCEPWHEEQYVRYASWPRCTSPGDFATYEEGLAPSRITGLLQRPRIPPTITSICLSVSIPPALWANAGIEVPCAPLAMIVRIELSSATAR